MEDVLTVQDLSVVFPLEDNRRIVAVDGVSFSVRKGESIALVGESGSGKSTIAFALFNSVPKPGQITSGVVSYFGGGNFLDLGPSSQRRIFWEKVSMVFQAAQNTLNPLLRIQKQIEDIAEAHHVDKKKAVQYANDLFQTMYLDPKRVLSAYPHELSGGMKQRVSIALALLLDPEIIVLDEPTTALDVISQASVLRILNDIRKQRNISLIFITHDISVISQVVDRVMVMYAGKIVESGPVRQIVTQPSHPYTRGLINSIPPLVGDLASVHGLSGNPVNLLKLTGGCPFAERCPNKLPQCTSQMPAMRPVSGDNLVACHLYEDTGREVRA
ncbi:MAG: ABC transporter ATP-binding protein [Alicyclobacillus sp.]|nr:ABC transporter ATP-binding protein [Alicyclobacillus sp.]